MDKSASVDPACVPCRKGTSHCGKRELLGRRKTVRQDLQYLYNVARDFMGKVNAWETIAVGLPLEGGSFRRVYLADVQSHLREWSWEKLGKLAAHGRGAGFVRVDRDGEASAEDAQTLRRFDIPRRATLLEVGFDETITNQMSGYRLLLAIAGLTVVAAMLDLARVHEREKNAQALEETLDCARDDYSHHGPRLSRSA